MSPARRRRLLAAQATVSALLGAALAVATNIATSLIPATWSWAHDPPLVWGCVVVLTTLVVILAFAMYRAQHQEPPETASPQQASRRFDDGRINVNQNTKIGTVRKSRVVQVGTMIVQHLPSPDHRARLAVGVPAAVTLIVLGSSGVVAAQRMTTVPPIGGTHPEQACAKLRAAGLRCAPRDPRSHEVTREINIVGLQHPAAGTRLPKGTAVAYTFTSTPPVTLVRYQAPAPASANLLSLTPNGPAGWSKQPAPGMVYEAGEDLPRVVPVYRYRCIRGCDEPLVFGLSQTTSWPKGKWKLEGPAFGCFSADAPPPGTRPLYSLRAATEARAWAVRGSSAHQVAVSRGFFDRNKEPLCYVWPPPDPDAA